MPNPGPSPREQIKALVELSLDNLDTECQRQPKSYLQFALKLADAKKAAAAAKNQVKVVEAELLLKVSSDPINHGIPKGTEMLVRAVVECHAKMKEAKQKLVDTQHIVDVLEASTGALDHKKQMIQNLTYLRGQSYFADPVRDAPKQRSPAAFSKKD